MEANTVDEIETLVKQFKEEIQREEEIRRRERMREIYSIREVNHHQHFSPLK
jgi:hypothetical protein